MANSKSEAYLHLTWPTHNRATSLKDTGFKRQVFDHIVLNARLKGISIEAIGGYKDHVHILIRLPKEIALSKVVQLIKGESAYWINRKLNPDEHFKWAEGYHVNAVPLSNLEKVKRYILDQELHHIRQEP